MGAAASENHVALIAPPFPSNVGVLRGPYSLGEPRHRKPLRMMKIIPLSTRLSSTRGLPLSADLLCKSPAGQCMGLGKEGVKTRHLGVARPEEIGHVHRSFFEP